MAPLATWKLLVSRRHTFTFTPEPRLNVMMDVVNWANLKDEGLKEGGRGEGQAGHTLLQPPLAHQQNRLPEQPVKNDPNSENGLLTKSILKTREWSRREWRSRRRPWVGLAFYSL